MKYFKRNGTQEIYQVRDDKGAKVLGLVGKVEDMTGSGLLSLKPGAQPLDPGTWVCINTEQAWCIGTGATRTAAVNSALS